MEIFLNKGVWKVVISGPFILMHMSTSNVQEQKIFLPWATDETTKARYDVKERDIITSTLTLDEFYRISICKTAREM